MSHSQSLLPELSPNRPSRASSCSLPVQPTSAAGRATPHRHTQSADMATQVKAGSGLNSEYQGAKGDKHKHAGYSTLTVISMIAILIPVAFVGGYSTALLTQQTSCQQHLSMAGLGKGGGDGRQLSHSAEQEGTLSLIEADAQRMVTEDSTALAIPQQTPELAGSSLPGANMMFVTWIAFGDFGDGGFKTHNFHKVDMRWADVARKSHPGCKIGLVMDQDTQLEQPEGVDFLHRLTIDKQKFGRNEYNDFYHWTARYSMLEKLQAEGQEQYNVVFMDPDIYVVDDLQEVFDSRFDYASTISENAWQPINGAMHFVPARRYGGAISILKGVLASFQLKPEMGFTAGQQAYSDFFELTGKEALVEKLQDDSVKEGSACTKIQDGEYSVCFFICTRYNFWEDCTSHPGAQVVADKAEDYAAAHVKVMHFIAYRKLGMQVVYDAFMEKGLEGAYEAWAGLPHSEAGYENNPRFAQVA